MNDSNKYLAVTAAWIGSSQIAMRLARILSTIVVARYIAPELLGIAAIALAINEIAHVFSKNATNARIIRASDSEVLALVNSAYYLNWIFGVFVFTAQCLVGFVLSRIYENPDIFQFVSVLGLSYLLLPIAQVHSALNLRDRKIGLLAKTEIQQTVADTTLTIIMVFAGFGVWALFLPKLAVVPLWIRAHRRDCNWTPAGDFSFSHAAEHFSFNTRVLGVELLGVIRHNIDYVIVGYFLGMHALGIYYFAFNAGLGITRGFIISLNNAFYPYLCASQGNSYELNKRFRTGLQYMLVFMIPLLALQAYYAEFYVPILFGHEWVERGAAQYVSLLCLVGIPLLVMEAGTQYMRAKGEPAADFRWHILYSLLFTVAIIIGIQWSLIGVVLSVMAVQFIAAPLYFIFVVKARTNNSNRSINIEEGRLVS